MMKMAVSNRVSIDLLHMARLGWWLCISDPTQTPARRREPTAGAAGMADASGAGRTI